MGDGFKRFKKKYLIDAIVKSVLAFFSASMLIVGAFLIAISLKLFSFSVLYAVLIALGVGLLLGILLFFLFNPNDKRLAKRLDKELGLREKIQTMYAFREDEGDIKMLQREDAQSILDKAPLRVHSLFKGWIVFIVAVVLTYAVFMVGLVMYADSLSAVEPPPTDSTPPDNVIPDDPDDDFTATNHHKVALEALIKEVEKSKLQPGAKEAVVAELTLLLAKIDTFKLESEMKASVVQSIKNVRGIVNTVNSTFAFHMYAKDSTNKSLSALSLALYSFNMERIEGTLGEIRQEIYVNDSRTEIGALKDELSALMSNSGIAENDTLYSATKKLHDDLADIVDHPTYTESGINRKLDTAFSTLLGSIKELIPQQKNNDDVKVYVVEELMRIFGITEEDLEENTSENDSVETVEPEERPERGDDGGFGQGETILGSDDIVIDPEANPNGDIDSINVKYATIIGRYDAKITEMVNNGEISEELIEILKKYFDVLVSTPSEN